MGSYIDIHVCAERIYVLVNAHFLLQCLIFCCNLHVVLVFSTESPSEIYDEVMERHELVR